MMSNSHILLRLAVGLLGGYILTSLMIACGSKIFVTMGYDPFVVVNWLTMLSFLIYAIIIMTVAHLRPVWLSLKYMLLAGLPMTTYLLAT